MLEKFLTPEQEEGNKKYDLFIKRVKEELVNKNKDLKQIKNAWGKDPKPLDEIINSVNNLYFFDKKYDIPLHIQKQVKSIYDSIFE
ncbi:hypothetical protein [Prolixibacter sp. NT017]|uniref:hypothetical protein n=1 Tax=Prolixibacter sp. NT017 TaxID=2652390 RepID=UPI001286BCB6|nr:hypothetical protein [Prolixibacter sp. NT017]GET25766.1 hypothetical protein NT017_20950 [Prolixibacter sp. NT017]